MTMPVSAQAFRLWCETDGDHSGFTRALHIDAPNATALFSREVFPLLIHGLWLLVHTVRLDIVKDEESTTVQLELTNHHD
jgi:hypothetical protein